MSLSGVAPQLGQADQGPNIGCFPAKNQPSKWAMFVMNQQGEISEHTKNEGQSTDEWVRAIPPHNTPIHSPVLMAFCQYANTKQGRNKLVTETAAASAAIMASISEQYQDLYGTEQARTIYYDDADQQVRQLVAGLSSNDLIRHRVNRYVSQSGDTKKVAQLIQDEQSKASTNAGVDEIKSYTASDGRTVFTLEPMADSHERGHELAKRIVNEQKAKNPGGRAKFKQGSPHPVVNLWRGTRKVMSTVTGRGATSRSTIAGFYMGCINAGARTPEVTLEAEGTLTAAKMHAVSITPEFFSGNAFHFFQQDMATNYLHNIAVGKDHARALRLVSNVAERVRWDSDPQIGYENSPKVHADILKAFDDENNLLLALDLNDNERTVATGGQLEDEKQHAKIVKRIEKARKFISSKPLLGPQLMAKYAIAGGPDALKALIQQAQSDPSAPLDDQLSAGIVGENTVQQARFENSSAAKALTMLQGAIELRKDDKGQYKAVSISKKRTSKPGSVWATAGKIPGVGSMLSAGSYLASSLRSMRAPLTSHERNTLAGNTNALLARIGNHSRLSATDVTAAKQAFDTDIQTVQRLTAPASFSRQSYNQHIRDMRNLVNVSAKKHGYNDTDEAISALNLSSDFEIPENLVVENLSDGNSNNRLVPVKGAEEQLMKALANIHRARNAEALESHLNASLNLPLQANDFCLADVIADVDAHQGQSPGPDTETIISNAIKTRLTELNKPNSQLLARFKVAVNNAKDGPRRDEVRQAFNQNMQSLNDGLTGFGLGNTPARDTSNQPGRNQNIEMRPIARTNTENTNTENQVRPD